MVPLGLRANIIGADRWRSLRIIGRPRQMPDIPKGHKLICSIKTAAGEYVVICSTLQHMQGLYDRYAKDRKTALAWYHSGVFILPLRMAA